MNVKLKLLTTGVLFFTGGALLAQKDTLKTTNVEEVVVLGYTKKKATEVTGNAVQLSSEEINTPSAISVDQALQGKTPGVVINASSGTPGSVQTIRIRGIGSMTASNDPLIVVDGVPVVNGDFSGSSAMSSISTLAALSNQDIESLTVLKDAAATAAYGARGSNGVIVITTKKGRKGKTRFGFNTSYGWQNDAYSKRNPLTGAQKLELLGLGLYNQYPTLFSTPEEAEDYAISYNLGNVGDWDGTEYNWPDLLTRKNAMAYTADISASGGDEKSTFYTSLGYNRTEATAITKNPFERITGNVKYTRDLTDRLKFETNILGSWMTQNPFLEQGSYFSNPYLTKILITPWQNPYDEDGNPEIGDGWFSSIHNTLYTLKNNIYRNTLLRGMANTKVDYKILKNLTFSTRFSIDYLSNDYKTYVNRVHGDADDVGGYAERSFNNNMNYVLQNSLNYNFRLANVHRFDLTALFEFQKNQADYLYGYGEGFSVDGLFNIANAPSNQYAYSSFSNYKNTSYLGMLNYDWAGRIIVDATIRREGSSRFAEGKRFGTFWSVGAAYNLNKDIFSDVFNELKLRASYGLTGNSGVGINQYQSSLAYDVDYAGEGGSYASTFGNAALTWEKNETLDIGLTFAILDSRISGSVAYYDKYTYDLLQDVPLSYTTGFSSQWMNAGAMTNKGWEASISFDIFRNENFTWNLSANIATVKNNVDELAINGLGEEISPISSVYKTVEVGKPYGFWYMRKWAGVDTETGVPLWYVNGVDGETTSDYNSAERSYQGSYIPKYSGGINTSFTYKNWFLNGTLYFAGGHKIYEQYAQFYMRTNSFTLLTYNGADELMNTWRNPGDVTDVPKMNYSTNDNFYNTSSRWLNDGTFARLKDVTFGYNLGKEALNAIGIDGLTFSVRGTNLWTWLKDKDVKLDPETGNSGGYTTLNTPPVKSVIFGVNIKF